MPIKLKCPNDGCGKVLEMPDQFAGKKGKCPSCGAMFMIPNPAARGDVAVGRVVEDRPSNEPAVAAVPPFEDFDRQRGRKKLRSKGRVDSTLMMGVGLAVLMTLFLAFTPFMPWWGGSNPFGSGSVSGWKYADGQIIFGISLGVGVIAGLALVLSSLSTLDREVADYVFAGGSLIGAAWGSIATFWHVGWIWKSLTLASKVSSASSQARSAFGARGAPIESSVYPHVGLFLGLVAAISIVTLFTIFANRRSRPEVVLIAHGIAFVAGLLIFILAVEPWSLDGIVPGFRGPNLNF